MSAISDCGVYVRRGQQETRGPSDYYHYCSRFKLDRASQPELSLTSSSPSSGIVDGGASNVPWEGTVGQSTIIAAAREKADPLESSQRERYVQCGRGLTRFSWYFLRVLRHAFEGHCMGVPWDTHGIPNGDSGDAHGSAMAPGNLMQSHGRTMDHH